MNRLKGMNRTTRKNYITYLVVIAAYVILEVLMRGGGLKAATKGMLVPICAYIVMALSLNLTVGIMGELSLGHAGFMSVGAFCGTATTMCLVNAIPSGGLRLCLGIIVGTIAAALVGFLIGIPVLRLRGDYLAIVTLAFGEIIKSIVGNVYMGVDGGRLKFSMFTNELNLSPNGRIIIEGAMGIRSIPRIATFTAGFILIMISLIVIFHMVGSRAGRAIMAIRDNYIAAESIGIPAFKYKITAFTISAAMAGAAGALFGNNYSSLIASKFNIDTSILVLVFVVLGGQGNMLGSIIAAAALTILPEALRGFADYRMLMYAIILIAVMLVSNNAKVKDILKNLAEKRAAKAMKGGAAHE
ncbi:MAG: branched-chain amino acid ABC transporter permease [Clostridia bacterium]|nr:branched-chain amino acid ABC transporter permease [Clostridia bacterium]